MAKISYQQEQLDAAAAFVWSNNMAFRTSPFGPTSIEDIKKHILENIHRLARDNRKAIKQGRPGDWSTFVGTAGYIILMTSDDDKLFNVEIYVNPATGTDEFTLIKEKVEK